MTWGIAGRIGITLGPGISPGGVNDISSATGTVTLPADYAGAALRLTTAVADGMTEGPEEFDVRVVNASSAGGDTVTPNSVPRAIIIIRDPAPVVAPGPAPGAVADNPAARAERLDAPATAAARGVGQLAAEAVMRRLHTAATANQLNLGRASTAEELLRSSGFSLAGGDGGRGFNFWGGGGYVSADGKHDGIDYDGDTSAFTLGIDTGWRDSLIGVAVARSDGDTDFTVTADGMKSTLETTVTSVHPYLTRQFNRSQIYLTAGHGSGDAELKEPDTVIKTDITVTTAAFGLTHAHDAQLSGGVSALYTRAKLDAAVGNGKTLNATTADSLRIAASAQARWPHGAWSPFADFTVRHDSGDGDTGIAGDLGGGIEFRAPAIHIRLAAATTIAADSAEEHRATLVIRKSSGDFALGLNLAADGSGLDTARLLHGEWRF